MQEILDGIEKFQIKLFPFLEKQFHQLASCVLGTRISQ
jgi:hypothetical protein